MIKLNPRFRFLFGILWGSILISSTSASAQTSGLVSDVFLSAGLTSISVAPLEKSDLIKLSPNSELLGNASSKYNHASNSYGYNRSNTALFGGLIGIRLSSKKSSNTFSPLLRLGFTAGELNLINDYLSYSESFPYDTVTSSRTGQQFISDSVAGSIMTIFQRGSHLSLHAALLFQTESTRRISIYTGIEAGFGLTFNNTSTITESKFSNINNNSEFYYSRTYMESNYKTEMHSNASGWVISTGVPIGISVRLAKTSPVLNKISLFTEIKPSLNFVNVPELRSFPLFGFRNLVGIRMGIFD